MTAPDSTDPSPEPDHPFRLAFRTALPRSPKTGETRLSEAKKEEYARRSEAQTLRREREHNERIAQEQLIAKTFRPHPTLNSLFTCNTCGAVVSDTQLHLKWHNALVVLFQKIRRDVK